jgi:alkanesulfonate monooxygenase SsuD/methylene tetrahydromethanopterin reductase-like flavin-dependent oxidoreductase (luciferase family)
MELGFSLSSEEHGPNALVEQARRAEEAGFTFALISDHYHPWIDQQGQSPFVWSVLGGIARETTRLRIGMRFYEREVLPTARRLAVGATA